MFVTIITPFYKGEKYIEGLLYMIKQNADECRKEDLNIKIEYLIVNDSPEVKLNLENPYTASFELKILTNKQNSGIHQTRVNGIRKAKGEFVLMLDQDDRLMPDAILSCVKKAWNADMVIGNGYSIQEERKRIIYRNKLALNMATVELFYAFCAPMCISPGHVLIRKSSIPEKWMRNIMKENGSDDYFLWLLMLDKKCKIAVIQKPIYEHIGTNENLSLDRKRMFRSSMSFCELAAEKKLLPCWVPVKKIKQTEALCLIQSTAAYRSQADMWKRQLLCPRSWRITL